jgi:hypothetical protein
MFSSPAAAGCGSGRKKAAFGSMTPAIELNRLSSDDSHQFQGGSQASVLHPSVDPN